MINISTDDDQHTRLMLSGERGQGDERSGICEDHRSSTAGTSAEAEKGRTAIIAKKGEQELQAEEGAACATDAEPAKQEGDEGTEKEGVGGLMQAIDVADVLEAQVASPVKRGARHNVFQEVFERRYSPLCSFQKGASKLTCLRLTQTLLAPDCCTARNGKAAASQPR